MSLVMFTQSINSEGVWRKIYQEIQSKKQKQYSIVTIIY